MREDVQEIINKKPVIMVVDDIKGQTKLLGLFLKKEKFESIEVHSARECLEKLTELHEMKVKVDCLIIDIAMPLMDGFELNMLIKEEPRFSDLPIIFMTAIDTDRFQKEIDKSGAKAVLQKPIDFDNTINMIKSIISLDRYKTVCNLMGNNYYDSVELLDQIRAMIGDQSWTPSSVLLESL